MPAKMRIAKITTSTGITMAATLVPWGAEINVTLLKSVKMITIRIYEKFNVVKFEHICSNYFLHLRTIRPLPHDNYVSVKCNLLENSELR